MIERARALCVEAPLDLPRFLVAWRKGDRARLVRATEPALVSRIAAAHLSIERDEVAIEEAWVEAQRAISARLPALRIGASIASLLGFVGVAIELGGLATHSDRSLLALDPTRLAAAAMGRAALSIALGLAASSFALGAWMALRAQARQLHADCRRALDRLSGLPE